MGILYFRRPDRCSMLRRRRRLVRTMTTATDDLSCRDVADFLMAYLDRELDPSQRAAFDAHLAVCDECVRYLRSYDRTVRLAKAAGREVDEPTAVPERLVRSIAAAKKT